MKQAFIAGCGYVGLHTAALLQKNGWQVSALTHSGESGGQKLQAAGINPFHGDLDHPADLPALELSDTSIWYFVPPPRNGVEDPRLEVARAHLAITHGMREAVRAVDRVFYAAGSQAIYRKHALERYFRDIHVAVQHAAGLPVHFESAGKVLLGLRMTDVGW